jgi:hypothetical protein
LWEGGTGTGFIESFKNFSLICDNHKVEKISLKIDPKLKKIVFSKKSSKIPFLTRFNHFLAKIISVRIGG